MIRCQFPAIYYLPAACPATQRAEPSKRCSSIIHRIWWTEQRRRHQQPSIVEWSVQEHSDNYSENVRMFLCPNQRKCGCTVQFSRGSWVGVVVRASGGCGLVFPLSVSWCMLILIFVWTVLGQPHTTRSGRIIDSVPSPSDFWSTASDLSTSTRDCMKSPSFKYKLGGYYISLSKLHLSFASDGGGWWCLAWMLPGLLQSSPG